MSKAAILAVALLMGSATSALAQAPVSAIANGDLTVLGDFVRIDVEGMGVAAIQVSNTYVGTNTFEVTADLSAWETVDCAPPNDSGSPINSTTSTGLWTCPVAGLRALRVRMTAYTSGTATVQLVAVTTGWSGVDTTTTNTYLAALVSGVNIAQIGGVVPTAAMTADFDTGGGTVTREMVGIAVPASGGPVAVPGDATYGFKVQLTDPCSYIAKTIVNINISTATTTELVDATGASNKGYLCALNLITAAANNVALVEDASDTCASPDAGMAGGVTAATGWNFAANGGIVLGSGVSTVAKTASTAVRICLMTSANTQLSGTAVFAYAP